MVGISFLWSIQTNDSISYSLKVEIHLSMCNLLRGYRYLKNPRYSNSYLIYRSHSSPTDDFTHGFSYHYHSTEKTQMTDNFRVFHDCSRLNQGHYCSMPLPKPP